MGDMEKAVEACRTAQSRGVEISDACARVIASMYHGGQASDSYALASSGYVHDSETTTGDLCRELFGDYWKLSEDEQLLYDMMGTYLLERDRNGRVSEAIPGWSELWL